MAAFNFHNPESFDFCKPEIWEKLFQLFERFRSSSVLGETTEEIQVNTHIYCKGGEADDIMGSFSLSADNSKYWDTVIEKQLQYFIPNRNLIFERASFIQSGQLCDENVDTFITTCTSWQRISNFEHHVMNK